MKLTRYSAFLLALGLIVSPAVLAAEADDGREDTMIMVQEGGTPDDVVNIIALPTFTSETAVEKAAKGQEKANSARDLGREFGQQMAEDAKSNNMGEQIRENLGQNARRDAQEENDRGRGRP